MKGSLIVFAAVCLLMTFSQVASAQQIPKIAGTWSVTIKMPEGNVSQQWVIQQNGGKVTGTAKTADGDLPLAGTIDEQGFLRIRAVGDDDLRYRVRATLDISTKNSFDGSIVVDKKEVLWSARLSK